LSTLKIIIVTVINDDEYNINKLFRILRANIFWYPGLLHRKFRIITAFSNVVRFNEIVKKYPSQVYSINWKKMLTFNPKRIVTYHNSKSTLLCFTRISEVTTFSRKTEYSYDHECMIQVSNNLYTLKYENIWILIHL